MFLFTILKRILLLNFYGHYTCKMCNILKNVEFEAFLEVNNSEQGLNCKNKNRVNQSQTRESNTIDNTFIKRGRNNAGTLSIRE